jgi:hypothetical protein
MIVYGLDWLKLRYTFICSKFGFLNLLTLALSSRRGDEGAEF